MSISLVVGMLILDAGLKAAPRKMQSTNKSATKSMKQVVVAKLVEPLANSIHINLSSI